MNSAVDTSSTPFDTVCTFPFKVQVKSAASERYSDETRPDSWDLRHPGIDVVKTIDGKRIKLFSDGGQSVPSAGWNLMITGGNAQDGYQWTLYGIPRASS